MEKYKNIPNISIVGRPNVGKSSLFNCLMEERRAVVVEQSGTTRDRVEAIIKIGKNHFKLVDTGGYVTRQIDQFTQQVKDQVYLSMEEADTLLFVTDSRQGVTPSDSEVAVMLRRFSKSVILVANKADNDKLKSQAVEFYKFGFGEPVEISCLHRKGFSKLKRRIQDSFKELMSVDEKINEKVTKIAVIGRPNVGKSSFVNNMLNRNRVIVSDVPGTTRDSIDTFFSYENEDYIMIDTAGIRHRRKIKTVVDTFSVMRSKESIKRADIVLLLLDAQEGAAQDDLGILRLVQESGKACIIVVNKWDLAGNVEDVSSNDFSKHLHYASNELTKYPIHYVSSKTGKNVINTLSMVRVLDANLDLSLSTPFLNKIFEENNPTRIPISRKRKRPNFLYITQSSKRPIEFKYFVSDPGHVLPSHLSYIENQLRSNLPLKGIPIKINIRKSRKTKK